MNSSSERKSRRGQVIVMAPIMLFVCGAMLALTADVGNLFVWRARLQNAADAAALAGIHTLVKARLDGADEPAARTAALAEAQFFHEANCGVSHGDARVAVEFGTLDEGGVFAEAAADKQATVCRAVCARDDAAPGGRVHLAFSALLGIHSCEVSGAAAAEVVQSFVGVVTGLGPFAIPEDRIVEPGQEMVFYPAEGQIDEGTGEAQVVPGDWGLLNLDGGSLGTPELIDWIYNGYDGTFEVSDDGYIWIEGTTGWRSGLQKPLKDMIGESMVMVIYDQCIAEGSNALYRCVGFVRGTITAVKLTGPDKYATFLVNEVGVLQDLIPGDVNPTPNILKIQLIE